VELSMSTATVAEFSAAATSFLDANLKPKAEQGPFRWGIGDDRVAIIEEKDPDVEQAQVEEAKAWASTRFDAGFGWIDGPAELDGAGLSAEHLRAYRALEARYEVPDLSCFTIGWGMVAPTLLVHANDEVKAEYLPALYRGDLLACQLFSEPGAGSDLAGIQTRARRDGDEWIINGQKVWTSGAHLAQVGEIICRTAPELPKHKGLTGFLVDMGAPGIDVRPLRQMTGGASFNEVFLTEVRVNDRFRLGEVNDGWRVALTTLMNERASIGSGMGLGPGPGPFERLIELARHFELTGDVLARVELARLYELNRVNALTANRGLADMQRSGVPGPELSTLKLAGTAYLMALSNFVSRVLGPRLLADTGEWGTYAWGQLVCGMPGARLGGGTDEVLKNIIAERVLGLPKEPA
jgi:acyl-CoA dehydrogenase